MLAWKAWKKAHEAKRRNILNGQRRRGRAKTLPQMLLEREISDMAATARRIRFYGKRTYMEMVNLCFEHSKIFMRPGEKIRIHFLHAAPSFWPAWRSFYEACRADARLEPMIILLDCAGTPLESPQHMGAREFLEEMNLPYTDYADYDLAHEKPHLIFCTMPYNAYYKYFRKVRPDLLKAMGIRLLYCTYGIEYDAAKNKEKLNAVHYHNDTQVLAWRSFVIHEDVRQGYFRFCRTGGEHVLALGHPKFDVYVRKTPPLLGHIEEVRRGRTVVFYQVHHPNDHDCRYAYRSHSLPVEETISIIRWLAEQTDVCAVITLHPLFEIRVIQQHRLTTEAVEGIKEAIRQSPNTVLYAGEYQPLLPHMDAFISDQSSLLLEMAFQNKPVLYLYDEPLHLKPFAGEIFASFYHGRGYGHGLADVREFLSRLKSGDDPLAGKRQQVWEKFFSSCNGRIGLHMKKRILNDLGLSHA